MHLPLQAATFALLCSALAAPASAVTVTYANFSQQTNAKLFRYAFTGGGNRLHTTPSAVSNALGEVGVVFSYLVPMPVALQGVQDAMLSFDAATTETITANGDTRSQGGFNGSLAIRRVVPLGGQDNLLTVVFTGATLFAIEGGGSATYTIAIPMAGSFMVQSSDFLSFGIVPAADFSLSFSAAAAAFDAAQGGFGDTFRANATGTFATTIVPEPAAWATLVIGFGLAGAAIRRRSPRTA